MFWEKVKTAEHENEKISDYRQTIMKLMENPNYAKSVDYLTKDNDIEIPKINDKSGKPRKIDKKLQDKKKWRKQYSEFLRKLRSHFPREGEEYWFLDNPEPKKMEIPQHDHIKLLKRKHTEK